MQWRAMIAAIIIVFDKLMIGDKGVSTVTSMSVASKGELPLTVVPLTRKPTY